MMKWLYNLLWNVVHKNDGHVLVWNNDDDPEDLEFARNLCLQWVDDITDILDDEVEPPPPDGPTYWDERLTELGITCEVRNGNRHLLAAWLTKNGSWDDVPSWAKRWQQDTLGGDHHIYMRVEDKNGNPIHTRLAMAWPPYGEDEGAVAYPEFPSGWGNFIMAGQNWNPDNGAGPYVVWVDGGDKLWGAGMPNNHHWSFFCVWVEEN